jgi:hypothetical protein
VAAQLAQSQQQAQATYAELDSLRAAAAVAATPAARAVGSVAPELHSAIEPVPFGETPLAGARLERIQGLLARLKARGFQGVVDIRSIPGRFCMSGGGIGAPTLAAEATPFARCEQVGNPREDNGSASERESVTFANMIATARENAGGRLDIRISAGSADETLTPYPVVAEGLTAGEWNRIGATNNRVEVRWQAGH